MKIALIGYGAMGKLIKTLAEAKGHEIAVICKSPRVSDGDTDASALSSLQQLSNMACDVAIDFSIAEAVRQNVEACVAAKIPLVVGTTGWNEQLSEIQQIVKNGNGALLFGANFSIGVNLFYRLAEYAAELFAEFPEYEVFIEEQHHSRKKDAPSGTALKIEELVRLQINKEADRGAGVPISSTRAGNIPGTHRLGFDGPADQILLTHTARTRDGFALGAIAAAEWIIGKKGVFEFADIVSARPS